MRASITDFISSLKNNSATKTYPHAIEQQQEIPLYDGKYLRSIGKDKLRTIQEEWARCWSTGAGVIIIKEFYPDIFIVENMSRVMFSIMEEENAKGQNGDHFAKGGSNSRIWNVLEKSAIKKPKVFIDYYSNALLGTVSEAWLGPNYKMTAQVNLVPPGGTAAQAPHRDYHLGFQINDEIKKFPLHAHKMSAMLTLQGAIAHIDMPVESGPTLFLPYSQQYDLGYLLYRQDELKHYFENHAVQLPLELGDAVFFNPALIHAAGSNTSHDIQRLANLLQISSAFGVPIETVNHQRIQLKCFDLLRKSVPTGDALETLLNIISDSYPFPTNLDRDIPINSLTPMSSKQLFEKALKDKIDKKEYQKQLQDYQWRRSTN